MHSVENKIHTRSGYINLTFDQIALETGRPFGLNIVGSEGRGIETGDSRDRNGESVKLSEVMLYMTLNRSDMIALALGVAAVLEQYGNSVLADLLENQAAALKNSTAPAI
ncbi:hypothetical protein [Victivallis sp. Marseille-Q1083]|uniref:hypothetical protein n=1 Tax=Victivallis sp. Marseille-Q1083 TaxID=2717288 RepID=UPI00158B9D0B|nr:hypothetical protein [Victivallis sp. Marseille-Q1083]